MNLADLELEHNTKPEYFFSLSFVTNINICDSKSKLPLLAFVEMKSFPPPPFVRAGRVKFLWDKN
jgi:hypothetical protein